MLKPIKILHITTSLSSNGGIEETLRILCSRLDKKLFQIGICSIKDKPEKILEEFRQMDVEIFVVHGKANYLIFLQHVGLERL